MKKMRWILIILTFISIHVYPQVGDPIRNPTGSVVILETINEIYDYLYAADANIDSATARVMVSLYLHVDTLYLIPPHSKMTCNDSAVTISGGSYTQITNGSDSLWVINEQEGITYIKGDTMRINHSGGYNIYVTIGGYGVNAVDWAVTPARKRSGVVTHGGQEIPFTTTGATNINGSSATFYGDFQAGDKIWLELTRKSGSGDFTFVSGIWNIQCFYRE